MISRTELNVFKICAHDALGHLRREAFQDKVADMLEKMFGDDFVRVRLSGGDGGLDGYCISTGICFQGYAPRDQRKDKIVGKIDNDFAKAKAFLKEQGVEMRGWTFVHNDYDGLPKEVVAKLGLLRQNNEKITIKHWAFDQLWGQLKNLAKDDLEDLFPGSALDANIDNLELQEIIAVLDRLSRQDPPIVPVVDFPDVKKLSFNKLSSKVKNHLKTAENHEDLVEDAIEADPNPMAGEAIAEGFRSKYTDLKTRGESPEDIFWTLYSYAGGEEFAGIRQQAAVYAVLAYYFHRCDIFENPE